ncbi:sentrin-specific protease 8-like [Prorops nasuta]|uniref:sentrin-specific protease 8-like n=1 Tax=Prorops nasuta TaxID=863751 RepID=UPI0034CE0258
MAKLATLFPMCLLFQETYSHHMYQNRNTRSVFKVIPEATSFKNINKEIGFAIDVYSFRFGFEIQYIMEKKDQKKSNDIVLSYYDCLVRDSDVALLKGPYWLDDIIIGFYFEYLGQRFKKRNLKKLLFISPELTQLLKMTDPSQYDSFLDPIGVSSSSFIFFPLNNCEKVDAPGGSHWSLLIYSKPEKTCFHFDSAHDLNSSVASKFADSIMTYLLNEDAKKYLEADCPQQENGFDCGLFVLCLADIISEHILQANKVEGCDCSVALVLAKSKRQRLLELIDMLSTDHECY